MQAQRERAMGHGWTRLIPSIILSLFCSALCAQETCPVEIKLLLLPSTLKSVVASMSLGKQKTSRIYFFDTDNLSLLAQGVIVRVRQGAKNDLTVKVRLPGGHDRIESSNLPQSFDCEIDQTEAGANTSYSVGETYKRHSVPEAGSDLFSALSPRQRELLKEAHVSIAWSRVKRVSAIRSSSWKTPSDSPFSKLTLEYWEFPGGSLLELSTRSSASEWKLRSADLHRIVKSEGLLPSANQETKTTTVLRGLTHDASPPE